MLRATQPKCMLLLRAYLNKYDRFCVCVRARWWWWWRRPHATACLEAVWGVPGPLALRRLGRAQQHDDAPRPLGYGLVVCGPAVAMAVLIAMAMVYAVPVQLMVVARAVLRR